MVRFRRSICVILDSVQLRDHRSIESICEWTDLRMSSGQASGPPVASCTFLDTSCRASSSSNAFTLFSLDMMICCSCFKLYGWKDIRRTLVSSSSFTRSITHQCHGSIYLFRASDRFPHTSGSSPPLRYYLKVSSFCWGQYLSLSHRLSDLEGNRQRNSIFPRWRKPPPVLTGPLW